MKSEMGKLYYKLTDAADTRDPLLQFFKDNGFTIENESQIRPNKMVSKNGLKIELWWFRNLCEIRVGEWGREFIEVCFDSIVGSFVPNSGHNTFDFCYEGKRTATLSFSKEGAE